MPRRLRRSYARIVMKIARRTNTKVWEYPLTRRDYNLNLRLRRDAEGLALLMDDAA